VYGRAAWGPTGVDLRFTGVLRFPSGVMAEFTSAFTMDHRGLEPIGDEGSALLVDPWQADPATLVLRGEVVARWHPEDPSPMEVPYFHEFENFSAAVRGEADILLGRDHAVGQARVLGALYESARTGREIALD
jgi:predicted dehydrogenase